ncbi:MAG: 5'-deoxynucleotidase [Clostridia bacterium]|nr:5'-deoxynucleotidase [Clostridia bacterium]
MKTTFYAMLFRQKYINRWGLMNNSRNETLSEHSFETAVTAHALALIGNTYFGRSYNADRIAVEALFHDSTEVFTGDMPTPAKYFSPELRKSYAKLEENAIEAFISKLPDELKAQYYDLLCPSDEDNKLLIKIADKLCAYIKCIDEIKVGNNEFRDAAESTLRSLQKYDSPELKYYMENILPTFEMTVDQL